MNFILKVLTFLIISPRVLLADEFILDATDIIPYQSWWSTPFVNYTKTKNGSNVELPSLESRLGVDPNAHLRFFLPVVRFSAPKGSSNHYGYGDTRAEIKFRFFNDIKESGYSAAIFPKFTLPVGSSKQGLGNGKAIIRLPLVGQKNWGNWKVSIGGTYVINLAKHQFNYFYGGPLIRNQITKKLLLGIEFVAQGNANLTQKKHLICNFGGQYNFTPNYFILFSGGHTIAGPRTLIGYLGFGTTWGPGI